MSYIKRVGTNSGMDYWNGTLDWTTGLSYNPFLGQVTVFIATFLTYLATMDDCSNSNCDRIWENRL